MAQNALFQSSMKYIGDSMMQKTYTPQVFPLRNIPNKGELDKYYAEDTHAPIINKEDFETVQRILQSRGELIKTQATKRLLTKILIYSKYRKNGYGSEALALLCSAAKNNGISVLYDDIAIDNPAVTLFLKHGFVEESRTEEIILLKKEL